MSFDLAVYGDSYNKHNDYGICVEYMSNDFGQSELERTIPQKIIDILSSKKGDFESCLDTPGLRKMSETLSRSIW